MAHHIISVSIFCFICATHSPCASHAAVGRIEQHRYDGYKDPNIPKSDNNPQLNLREKLWQPHISDSQFDANPLAESKTDRSERILKRSIDKNNTSTDSDSNFLQKIFLTYGDGDKMTVEGFEKLLRRLDLLQMVSNRLHLHEEEEQQVDVKHEAHEVMEHNETCFNKETITILQQTAQEGLNHTTFSEACPLLIYSLLAESCPPSKNNVFDVAAPKTSGLDPWIWFYSCMAVFLISICGVGALIIIPLMQKRFYKPLIQFLVALAVGTLAGDALLHLLPHAMGGGHSHGHGDGHGDPHLENTWKGLVAMLGLTFFFIMERLILVAGKWRKKKQKHKTVAHAHVKVYNDKGERRTSTQCMDKYNTSPYCYKDIMNDPPPEMEGVLKKLATGASETLGSNSNRRRPLDPKRDYTSSEPNPSFLDPDNSAMELLGSQSDLQMKNSRAPPSLEKLETNNVQDAELISTPCIEAKMLPHDHEDYTVIVREHANDHHGHSHKHGHVHAAPQNLSSVAWMVIMGDGLHNFTDGMAIGAAFASGLAGGFSTTVAVFCHELPHELGDFAMLLKAGMTIKQALFYNLLSSGLCILGNLVGLYLGNTETANQWVFAAAAGTFIYIALVDMIPELSSAHDDEDNLRQCLLHLSGLLIGVGIMTIIALYEHDLKNLFHEPD